MVRLDDDAENSAEDLLVVSAMQNAATCERHPDAVKIAGCPAGECGEVVLSVAEIRLARLAEQVVLLATLRCRHNALALEVRDDSTLLLVPTKRPTRRNVAELKRPELEADLAVSSHRSSDSPVAPEHHDVRISVRDPESVLMPVDVSRF